jgi:hypothetical protein
VSEYHNIAWAYVTMVIAVLSLLYPLALALRESLTARLFAAFDELRKSVGHGLSPDDAAVKGFEEETFVPIGRFRKWVFGRLLPAIAAFSICSALRVLTVMLGLGLGPGESHMLEPQLFVMVYLLWMASVMLAISKTQPFRAVERGEARARRLPPLERRPDESAATVLRPAVDGLAPVTASPSAGQSTDDGRPAHQEPGTDRDA